MSLPESSSKEVKTLIKKNDLSYLGKTVTVTTDRPIGSEHPKHKGLIYPINYGYAQGLVAGDGEEQDVYILGIDKPVERAEVVIIGVILRKNDNEDKWVGVPKELVGSEICCECNILKQTHFQEQYYDIEVKPLYEKTCGTVIYTENENGRRYFLIRNKSGHIGFPKGHIEYGESEIQTAVREVREETGFDFSVDNGFRAEYTFTTLENTIKNCVFFLGRYDASKTAEIQLEEVTDDWLLSYDDAMGKLNWEQDKQVLLSAEEFLKKGKQAF